MAKKDREELELKLAVEEVCSSINVQLIDDPGYSIMELSNHI